MKKTSCFTEYTLCDHRHFQIIKGISIFIIVLVHLCNRYLNFPYLSPVAGAAVAVFLLCSGYGLSESFEKKGLEGFWANKIIKVWLPSFLSISIFSLIAWNGLSVWAFQHPFFLYGWYLQVLFGEYIVFWLAFRFLKNKNIRMVTMFAVSVVAFILIRSQLYAEQLFCFPIGVAFSQMHLKEKMGRWKAKQKIVVLLGCAIAAGVFFLLRKLFTQYCLVNSIWAGCKMSIAFLICLVPYYCQKLRVLDIMVPLGTISYMLYLLNNDILRLLENGTSWYVVAGVLALLIVAAYVFKWLCDFLARVYAKTVNRQT